jgi:hypothetical protein
MSKKKNMKIQPVAFNLDSQHQQELWDHAMAAGNFSSYIKNLIYADMTRGQHQEQPQHQQAVTQEPETDPGGEEMDNFSTDDMMGIL